MSTTSTQSMNKNVVIVAPHVDDELIGCWSYLRDRRVSAVIYLEELSAVRRAEATTCANTYGFEAVFDCAKFTPAPNELLLVPAITDSHPAHRAANRAWRGQHNNVMFYSVDMDRSPKTLLHDWEAKKAALDYVYPSQKALWETNASYYLFEHVARRDYNQMTPEVEVRLTQPNTVVKVRTESSTNGPYPCYETIVDLINHVSGFYFRIETAEGIVYESRN